MRVGFDPVALVQRNARGVKTQALGVRTPADRQQHDVGFDLDRGTALGGFGGQGHAGVGHDRAGDLGPEAKFQPLLHQDALKGGRDLGVDPRHDAVEVLDHRDLRPQPAPDAAELQPNDAGANDHQMRRHRVQLQRASGGNDPLLVHRHAGERGRFAAGGDNDVFRGMHGPIDIHLPAGDDAAGAFEPGDLVLTEQEFDAFDVGADNLPLAGLHAGKVQCDPGHHDAVIGEGVGRLIEILRRVQQRLGGDAAHVQAGAAEGGAFFDAGHFHAQLRGSDGANVAAGAGADNDDVEGFGHVTNPATTAADPPPLPSPAPERKRPPSHPRSGDRTTAPNTSSGGSRFFPQ